MSKEPTIKEITSDYWDHQAHAIAILDDDSIVVLFSWFTDELWISEEWDLEPFIGETPDVARAWKIKRDIAYLRG